MMKTFVFVLLLSMLSYTTAELRWCKVTNRTLSITEDGWIQYEDTNHTCLVCSPDSVVLLHTVQLQQYECCNGRVENVGNCPAIHDGINTPCFNAIKCDGIKQCSNGSDEIGCGQCSGSDMLNCDIQDRLNLTNNICVSQNKVCDSRKDCSMGFDETGCQWHRGWCDGFLCGKPHERCIPHYQVCDGVKQCIDGADEANCAYCDHQFQCRVFDRNVSDTSLTRTAQCVGMFRVCDGRPDCDNGLDESNCFRWREWSTWSACHPPDICTRSRSRACVSWIDAAEVGSVHCYGVEDYDEVPGLPSVEQQTQICPLCIPTNPLFIDTDVAPPIVGRPGAKPFHNENPDFASRRLESDDLLSSSNKANQLGNSSTESTTNAAAAVTELSRSNRIGVDTASTISTPTGNYESTKSTTFVSPTSSVSNDVTSPSVVMVSSSETLKIENTTMTLPVMTKTSTETTKQADNAGVKNETAIKTFSIRPRFYNVTRIMDHSTPSTPPERQISYLKVVFIVAAAAGAAALLVFFICLSVCCCSERRGRAANWKLPKRLNPSATSGVPQMYKDVQINNVESVLDKYATSQDLTLTRTSSRATPGSHGDSGIEDAASTSSRHSIHTDHATSTLSSSNSTPS